MIKNYAEYTQELSEIQARSHQLAKQQSQLHRKELDIAQKLNLEVYDYVIEQFSKKLTRCSEEIEKKRVQARRLNHDMFLLNDRIGIYISPIQKYQTEIVISMIFVNNSIPVQSDRTFKWSYESKDSIDKFISHIMNELERVYKFREDAEIKRMAKKYNL
jgi:hypothetical protein